jgi:hypothetical protein
MSAKVKATKATVTNAAPVTKSYRLCFLGKDSTGKRRRAVRHVQATSLDQAYEIMAQRGEEIAKTLKFQITYTTVACPLKDLEWLPGFGPAGVPAA